jgi:glycerol uptake operon antiterminator
MNRPSIAKCFQQPVIPVVWDPSQHASIVSRASAVFLQGGNLANLPRVLDKFQQPQLAGIAIFAHIDLIAGLENSEAALDYLAELGRLAGIVTIHHHLAKPARRLGLLSIVRLFLSDSRSVERGDAIARKSHADAIEILPAAAAVKVAADLDKFGIPRIAGGLCRTEADVREALQSGCRCVTSTRRELWELNAL